MFVYRNPRGANEYQGLPTQKKWNHLVLFIYKPIRNKLNIWGLQTPPSLQHIVNLLWHDNRLAEFDTCQNILEKLEIIKNNLSNWWALTKGTLYECLREVNVILGAYWNKQYTTTITMAGHFKPKFEHKLSLIIPSCHGFLKEKSFNKCPIIHKITSE